ncbi:MAG TPA: TolC family protein [Terriglobia bacterium]|nr:TolC family protein [Terriglobia bacterium]
MNTKRNLVLVFTFIFIGSISVQIASAAQAAAARTPPRVFTVQEAVSYALANYPAVRASLERYNAARAAVGVARTSYIPRVDGVWQGDRGTRNSVLGVLMPQFPTIMTGTQGTVLPFSDRAYWVSGMGVLFSWEPFTFGYRRAQLRSAHATENRTAAQITLTRLGVSTAVAEASLAVLAAEQRVKASQADVDRRTVFARSVHALVNAHLRPGADASRADAELAAARTQMIQAEEARDVARARLAEIMGIAGTPVEITPSPFLQVPSESIWAQPAVATHPAATVEQRSIEEIQSRISVLNHSFYPHFTLEELSSARGSGENSRGESQPGLGGLSPSAYNWQAGLTVQLNLTDIFSIRERKKVEVANRRREEALYAQTVQTLTGQVQQAQAALDGARRVAQNTPVELQASRDSEAQARARFQAGVGTIVDVAEAQSLLVQAEIDDSLARLAIWRALAELASDGGDLTPFLNLAGSMQTGAP